MQALERITNDEWANGRIILRLDVGPHSTITVKDCEHGLIKCLASHWLVKHERISRADFVALEQYARKVGAM